MRGPENLRTKLWSYRRGFLSEQVSAQQITKENWRAFISEVEYNRASGFPNGPRSRWFDDKLATYFLLKNLTHRLPEHFFHVQAGQVLGLAGHADGFGALERVLEDKKALVVKHSWGSKGTGFQVLTRKSDQIDINGERIEFSEFPGIIERWPDSIVTERLVNHAEIASLHPQSLNTLRIITAYTPTLDVSFVCVYLRVGTADSGLVDNVIAGGLALEIDASTGSSVRSFKYSTVLERPTLISHHPNTHQSLEVQVPFWKEICQEISTIARELKVTPWLGFDVAVSPDDFFITEINSHTTISQAQSFAPLRSNNAVQQLFPGP